LVAPRNCCSAGKRLDRPSVPSQPGQLALCRVSLQPPSLENARQLRGAWLTSFSHPPPVPFPLRTSHSTSCGGTRSPPSTHSTLPGHRQHTTHHTGLPVSHFSPRLDGSSSFHSTIACRAIQELGAVIAHCPATALRHFATKRSIRNRVKSLARVARPQQWF
jgi:hypothetical protein